jgi:hypothetical protein
MRKFIGLIIVATSLVSPAFAQSFDADNGTANLVTGGTATPAVSGSLGYHAYAMSTRRKAGAVASDTLINNPGGSVGYNEMLRNW